jgi:hypothetical protein
VICVSTSSIHEYNFSGYEIKEYSIRKRYINSKIRNKLCESSIFRWNLANHHLPFWHHLNIGKKFAAAKAGVNE